MSREIAKLRKYVLLLEEKVVKVAEKMVERNELLVLKSNAADFIS